MASNITMPKLTDTMEEGKILRWLKQVGDRVDAGEIIVEVETDKADMEVEAPQAGVVKEIRAREGDTATVGEVIGVLSADGVETGSEPPAKAEVGRKAAQPQEASPATQTNEQKSAGAGPSSPKITPPPARPVGAEGPKRASPLARRVAATAGVDLQDIAGTGPRGSVSKKDVERAAASAQESRPGTDHPRPLAGRVELSKMRLAIAKKMAEAKREIPHFYVMGEIDMGDALRLRESLERTGAIAERVTITHMVIKATALALQRHPRINAAWDDGGVRFSEAVNIGIATAVEDGLVVPVLKGCERMSLADVARASRDLNEKAKTGRFSGSDMMGGTFSISNMGMLEVDAFAAVINPPQAAILAVGAVKERPVVRDGKLVAAQIMKVTLSCDHRILSGAEGAAFLREITMLLENPGAILVAAR
jgi:pyruvate dehydrogenase E2 component (dihydrolipoamide acetyltransferase)